MNPNGSPVEGGRRPGDDPFLTDTDGAWNPLITLVVMAVVLGMVLLALLGSFSDSSGTAEDDEVTPEGMPDVQQPDPVPTSVSADSPVPGPGGWTGSNSGSSPQSGNVLSATRGASDAPTAFDSPAPMGLSTTRPMGGAALRGSAGRTFQARRRALLVEAERLLGALPPTGSATPEQRRDRRALEQLIHEMDSPAR